MPVRNRASTAQSQSRSPITTLTELISNITLKGIIQTLSSAGAYFIKLAESKVRVINWLSSHCIGFPGNSWSFEKL